MGKIKESSKINGGKGFGKGSSAVPSGSKMAAEKKQSGPSGGGVKQSAAGGPTGGHKVGAVVTHTSDKIQEKPLKHFSHAEMTKTQKF